MASTGAPVLNVVEAVFSTSSIFNGGMGDVTGKRLTGISAVKELFGDYRGRPLFDSYEIEEPTVQEAGDAAVLSYVLVTRNGSLTRRWNATQVYQKKKEGWRVIHSHFSANDPQR
jgi:ketosteroid isomerase-like protein